MPNDWILWLDDLRQPYIETKEGRRPTQYALNARAERCLDNMRWATTSSEAMRFVTTYGMPSYMYLDHDLGGEDTSMNFLKWVAEYVPDPYKVSQFHGYRIISANPIGSKNIESFMNSWEKSLSR